MGRYFFHIRDASGHIIPDDEGVELNGADAAWAEAKASAYDLTHEAITNGYDVSACAVEIWDQTGALFGAVKVPLRWSALVLLSPRSRHATSLEGRRIRCYQGGNTRPADDWYSRRRYTVPLHDAPAITHGGDDNFLACMGSFAFRFKER